MTRVHYVCLVPRTLWVRSRNDPSEPPRWPTWPPSSLYRTNGHPVILSWRSPLPCLSPFYCVSGPSLLCAQLRDSGGGRDGEVPLHHAGRLRRPITTQTLVVTTSPLSWFISLISTSCRYRRPWRARRKWKASPCDSCRGWASSASRNNHSRQENNIRISISRK